MTKLLHGPELLLQGNLPRTCRWAHHGLVCSSACGWPQVCMLGSAPLQMSRTSRASRMPRMGWVLHLCRLCILPQLIATSTLNLCQLVCTACRHRPAVPSRCSSQPLCVPAAFRVCPRRECEPIKDSKRKSHCSPSAASRQRWGCEHDHYHHRASIPNARPCRPGPVCGAVPSCATPASRSRWVACCSGMYIVDGMCSVGCCGQQLPIVSRLLCIGLCSLLTLICDCNKFCPPAAS